MERGRSPATIEGTGFQRIKNMEKILQAIESQADTQKVFEDWNPSNQIGTRSRKSQSKNHRINNIAWSNSAKETRRT